MKTADRDEAEQARKVAALKKALADCPILGRERKGPTG